MPYRVVSVGIYCLVQQSCLVASENLMNLGSRCGFVMVEHVYAFRPGYCNIGTFVVLEGGTRLQHAVIVNQNLIEVRCNSFNNCCKGSISITQYSSTGYIGMTVVV